MLIFFSIYISKRWLHIGKQFIFFHLPQKSNKNIIMYCVVVTTHLYTKCSLIQIIISGYRNIFLRCFFFVYKFYKIIKFFCFEKKVATKIQSFDELSMLIEYLYPSIYWIRIRSFEMLHKSSHFCILL